MPEMQTRSRRARARAQQILRHNQPSIQAPTTSTPTPTPRPPHYRPWSIPPLGSDTQLTPASLANESHAFKQVGRDTVNQRAKQSVSLGWKIPLSPRVDNSRRYSTAPLARPVPSGATPPQPRGRRSGAPPPPPTSKPPLPRRSPSGTAVQGPTAPVPDAFYIAQSAVATAKLPFPQPLLLVLDLNGTLLYRPKASSSYKPRPFLIPFLAHCISNYNVMIWSSATPQNVTAICSQIFTPQQRQKLLGEWARDTLDLTSKQYQAKVQVYKRLDRIWSIDRIQRSHEDFGNGQRWGQWNTLLLDDSVMKSSAQPYNAVVVPEFTKEGVTQEAGGGADILGQVVAYLETARTFGNVSSFVRNRPFQVSDGWRWDWARARALVG